MKNNNLKERVRKSIKEEIAISNIRKEFDMKTNKDKRMFYSFSSACAVFILGIGIIAGTNNLDMFNDNNVDGKDYNISELQIGKENKQEMLKSEINICKVENVISSDMDVKYDNYNSKMPLHIWENILKEFEEKNGISYETFINKIPEKIIYFNFYTVSTRGYKDVDLPNVYHKHDYVFEYHTANNGKIKIALCKEEKPLRDYLFEFKGKKSKISDIELEISQYKNSYIANFEFNNINYDIETNGITENELIELLNAILTENTNKNTVVEDKDVNVNENTNKIVNFPDYYAGKYVDNNGNNVILLSDDSSKNRKEICNILGITQNKTIFKRVKYTYEYLTQLQNKISKKMQDKELPFVISSSLMEDSNNIKVIVTTNNAEELNKIKALDTIGGAIEIKYESNVNKIKELIINFE